MGHIGLARSHATSRGADSVPGDPNHIRPDGSGGGALRVQLGGHVAAFELSGVTAGVYICMCFYYNYIIPNT